MFWITTPDTLNVIITVVLLIVSYLIGSIPFGLVIGRLVTGVDLRQHGSKNIGSTNAVRVLGKKVGALVFLCDVLKGAIIVIILKILKATGVWTSILDVGFFGLAAILGHSYSCFLKFKGGKAVATSLGVVLVICPLAGIACLIVFILTVKYTGYVSLGSTFAMLTVFFGYMIFHLIGVLAPGTFLDYFTVPSWQNYIAILPAAIIILYKHIPNYKRLIAGTENSFKKKKAAEPVAETTETVEENENKEA